MTKINSHNLALKVSEIGINRTRLSRELEELKVNEEIIKFNIAKTKESLKRLDELQKLGDKLFSSDKENI